MESIKLKTAFEKWVQELSNKTNNNINNINTVVQYLDKSLNWENDAIKIFSLITEQFKKSSDNIRPFNELVLWICQKNNNRKSLIEAFWSYQYALYIDKKYWLEYVSLLPAVELTGKEQLTDQRMKMYFDITKCMAYSCASSSVQCTNPLYLNIIYNNFTAILEYLIENKKITTFLTTFDEIFHVKYAYAQRIFELDKNIGWHFVENCIELMKAYIRLKENESEINADELFINLTRYIWIFLNMRLKMEANPSLKSLLKFVKLCKSNIAFENLKLPLKCFDCLSTFLYILDEQDVDKNDLWFTTFLCITTEITSEKDVLKNKIVLDTNVMIALIFNKFGKKIEEKITKKSLTDILKIIKSQMSIILDNKKIPINCCTSTKKHCILMLIEAAINLVSHAARKDLLIEDHIESIRDLIIYHFYILKKLKCEQQIFLRELAIKKIYNILILIGKQYFLEAIVKIIEILIEEQQNNAIAELTNTKLLDLLARQYAMSSNIKNHVNVETLFILYTIREFPGQSKDKILRSFNRLLAFFSKNPHYSNNIVDILENEEIKLYGFPLIAYESDELLLLQMEALDSIYPKKIIKENVMRKIISITKDPFKIAEAFCYLDESSTDNFIDDINNLISALNVIQTDFKIEEEKAKKINLYLGFLYYRCFLCLSNHNIESETVTEKLINEQKWKFGEEFEISKELNLINYLRKSLNHYKKFMDGFETDLNKFQMKIFIKTMISIGGILKFYNYIEEAIEMFVILYALASKTNHRIGLMTAISNIALHARQFNVIRKIYPQLKRINDLITLHSDIFIEKLKSFADDDDNTQNLMIICLVSFAKFYIEDGHIAIAIQIIEIAWLKMGELEKNPNEFDYMQVQLFGIIYLMATKYSEKTNYSYRHFLKKYIQIFTNITHTQVDISRDTMFLLFNIIKELVDYSIVRYETLGITHYVYMILKVAMRRGMVLRMAEILIMLANIDQNTEKMNHCKSKYYYLIKILELNDKNSQLTSVLEMQDDNLAIANTPSFETILDAESFFEKHNIKCVCNLCATQKFKILIYEIGCLFCRHFFLEKSYSSSKKYYQEMIKNYSQLKEKITETEKQNFIEFSIRMILHYSNTLMRNNEPIDALSLCQTVDDLNGKLNVPNFGLKQDIQMQIISVNHMSMLKRNMNVNSQQQRNKFSKKLPQVDVVLPSPTSLVKSKRSSRSQLKEKNYSARLKTRLKLSSSDSESSLDKNISPLEKSLDAKYSNILPSMDSSKTTKTSKINKVKQINKDAESKTVKMNLEKSTRTRKASTAIKENTKEIKTTKTRVASKKL